PVVRCAFRNMDERAMYSVILEFVQIGDSRWKFQNGDWVTGGKAEPPSRHTLFLHPESPNFGSHWCKTVVAFNKVKLTNKPTNDSRFVSSFIYINFVSTASVSHLLFFFLTE